MFGLRTGATRMKEDFYQQIFNFKLNSKARLYQDSFRECHLIAGGGDFIIYSAVLVNCTFEPKFFAAEEMWRSRLLGCVIMTTENKQRSLADDFIEKGILLQRKDVENNPEAPNGEDE
jgi:hypothetical protein